MATYQIQSKSNKAYRVLVANCSKEHAQSVLKNLIEDKETPNDLRLGRKWR